MGNDDDVRLVSPCGLYCGGCPVFRAGTDEAFAARLAERLGLPKEQVQCRGCRTEEGHIRTMGEPVCPTYVCVQDRGLRFCYECDEFPCLMLAPCADKAQTLPHNTKVYSLVLMQRLGLEEWLRRAGQFWSQYFRGTKERGGDPLKI